VQLAPSDDRVVQDVHDGLAQGAAAIEHDQDRLGDVQAAVAQTGEQIRCQGGVLGRALHQRQRMFGALQVDAERHDAARLGEVHPLDHHRDQVQRGSGRR